MVTTKQRNERETLSHTTTTQPETQTLTYHAMTCCAIPIHTIRCKNVVGKTSTALEFFEISLEQVFLCLLSRFCFD